MGDVIDFKKPSKPSTIDLAAGLDPFLVHHDNMKVIMINFISKQLSDPSVLDFSSMERVEEIQHEISSFFGGRSIHESNIKDLFRYCFELGITFDLMPIRREKP